MDPKLLNRFFPPIPEEAMKSIQRRVKAEYNTMLDGLFRGIDDYLALGLDYPEAIDKATQGGSWLRAINERTSAITARLATEEYAAYQGERLGRTPYKVWQTQRDDRVRPKHQIDGEKQHLDHQFSNGIAPGQEWRCRCFLKIVFEDDSKASHESTSRPLTLEIDKGFVGPEAKWAAESKANDDKWREWVLGAPKIPDVVKYD